MDKTYAKHQKNLNRIKEFMTNDDLLNSLDYNTAQYIVNIYKKVPKYLRHDYGNIYHFCDFCYQLICSYDRNIECAKKEALEYREFIKQQKQKNPNYSYIKQIN